MMDTHLAPIDGQLDEYVSELTLLWLQRCHAVKAPHYDRSQFADLDEQLAAHIDGVRGFGDAGWSQCESALAEGGAEHFFVATQLALDAPGRRMGVLLSRLRSAINGVPGVISAVGWASPSQLAEFVRWLGPEEGSLELKLRIAAHGVHRRDPGALLERFLTANADSVKIRALRVAGELGRVDMMPALLAAVAHPKPEVRFWAAWSACLLGDRSSSLRALVDMATKPGRRQLLALRAAMLAIGPAEGHALLRELDGSADATRLRIIGAGHAGDPRYVPWLISRMSDPATARIAAEAFVGITGVDFNAEQMEAMPPEDFEDGPTDDPDDESVELPEDVALPWPQVDRINAWWSANESRFSPGKKLFLGHPIAREHCVNVLKTGFQRWRTIAAHHLCLLQPGTVLFPTSAPAWRQQALLEAL